MEKVEETEPPPAEFVLLLVFIEEVPVERDFVRKGVKAPLASGVDLEDDLLEEVRCLGTGRNEEDEAALTLLKDEAAKDAPSDKAPAPRTEVLLVVPVDDGTVE